MAEFSTRKGFHIRLSGAPSDEVKIVDGSDEAAVYPQEFAGIKPRLLVKEGDSVKQGSPLFIDKKCPELRFSSPAAGKIRTIEYGPRRAIEKVIIDLAASQQTEAFPAFEPAALRSAARDAHPRRGRVARHQRARIDRGSHVDGRQQGRIDHPAHRGAPE